MKRIHATVSGRVQGVYYRASTQEKATSLGLTGWVRNLANGDVEFEAEGPDSTVDALIEWANQGPPMASVNNMVVTTIPTTTLPVANNNRLFDIRY